MNDEFPYALELGEKELLFLISLTRRQLRKDQKRPGRPPPGGRDAQEYKIERRTELLEYLEEVLAGQQKGER